MKAFESIKLIFLLFVICISVSAVIMFVNNLEIVVAYCALAFVLSFWIMCRRVEKHVWMYPDYCFKFVFYVIVSFVVAMAIVCIISGLFSIFWLSFSGMEPYYVFSNSLEFAQVLSIPFVVVLLESAVIMLINRFKICTKKRGLLKFPTVLVGNFFCLIFTGNAGHFFYIHKNIT